jgi:hypothetical protein
MNSFISNFRAIVAALLAIIAIEVIIYAARPSSFVERSNYLDWNLLSAELFHKALIYEKLSIFANSAPDIIQVGDSSGFHGVNPDIVMEYLNGLTYLNLSCCANTGFDGYYAIADFMFRRNPTVKVLVLYLNLNNLPQDGAILGDRFTGGAERIRNSFAAPWAYLSPPSMAHRWQVTDAVYSFWGRLRLRPSRMFGDGDFFNDVIDSMRLHRGWWPEHDPRLAGAKLAEYWRSICGETGVRGVSDADQYYTHDLILGRRSRVRLELQHFANLAARYGARLVIMFHPYPCRGIGENFLAARGADVESVQARHDNVIVLPPSVFEPWPVEDFVSVGHLRVGYDEKNSRRVGRLLAEALRIAAGPNLEKQRLDEAANAIDAPFMSSIWADDKFSVETWVSEGISILHGEGNVGNAAGPTKLIEGVNNGFHRMKTKLEDVEPGASYILSVVAKPVGNRALHVEARDAREPGHHGYAECDMQDLTAQRGGAMLDVGLDALPEGWFRCSAMMSFGRPDAIFDIGLSKGHAGSAYQGDGKSGVLLSSAELRRKTAGLSGR